MPDNKVNNPEGKNQYTGKGKSSEPYRYSIGGYFATKNTQKTLNTLTTDSYKRAEAANKEAGQAYQKYEKIPPSFRNDLSENEYKKVLSASQKANEEMNRSILISEASANYRKISNPIDYSKAFAKQTVVDTKQIAQNIRKRMWGG
jgi:hypothetical protein